MVRARAGEDLSTDQLLNAIYLVHETTSLDPEQRDRACQSDHGGVQPDAKISMTVEALRLALADDEVPPDDLELADILWLASQLPRIAPAWGCRSWRSSPYS